MADLVQGVLITPSVRLVRELGAGGMGSVWVADHLTLHTQVVVKFMAKELAKDTTSVARFSREAAAASQVKSPHVVQTFDHGVSDGVPFIVMELLDGEDLAHRLERQTRLPVEDVAMLVTQVAKALTRAHERGVVHRDIKPENIFLCDAGGGEIFVKVLDFGIAKSADQQVSGNTATGQMVGTPYYMSPEQLTGSKHIDFHADLWALGVVTFQALTGQRPFQGDSVTAIAIAIHTGDCAPPSTLNSALTGAVDDWFKKACAREPADRFASAKEMAAALRVAAGVKLEESTSLRPNSSGGVAVSDALRVGTDSGLAMQKTEQAGSQSIPVQPSSLTHGAVPQRAGWMIPAAILGALLLGGGLLLLTFGRNQPGSSADPSRSNGMSTSTSTASGRATIDKSVASEPTTVSTSTLDTAASTSSSTSRFVAPSASSTRLAPLTTTKRPAPSVTGTQPKPPATTKPPGYDDIQ